ncbi:MAG: glycosyltransferase [Deltaproteobacteria bacterium]|nr:glycosyltransferase [Deltaproteobacteria bacterium]
MYSLIIPIYKNEDSIAKLVQTCAWLHSQLSEKLEVVFVLDGSPDRSFEVLETELIRVLFDFQIVSLSKNCGSFAAIRKGLEFARGDLFAVMAADLQEPKELIVEFFKVLSSENYEVVLGMRKSRHDPLMARLASNCFWWLYKKMIQPEMPTGGVDVFGCNRLFRDHLLGLKESHSSLVGLILWMGFRRKIIPYDRSKREFGKSAWTLSKKFRYMLDNIFSFTDLPIQLLALFGCLGVIISIVFGTLIVAAKLSGAIGVPGYAATALLIMFFASLNSLGLGIIGIYVWRAFENTKQRPEALVMEKEGGTQWKATYIQKQSVNQ